MARLKASRLCWSGVVHRGLNGRAAPQVSRSVSRINADEEESSQITYGGTMTHEITVSREQAMEIYRAVDGIAALLKKLPSNPETAPVMYAIMGNVAIIQMNIAEMPRVNPN